MPYKLNRQESLGYEINHLARLFAGALRVRIAPHGVVPGQFAQLLALYERDGITQTQLCQQVQIDQSTMAHTLKRMQRDGLVERAPDPADGRQSLITLTRRARQLENDLAGAAITVNAAATKDFSAEEIALCLQLLKRMRHNLEAEPGAQAETVA